MACQANKWVAAFAVCSVLTACNGGGGGGGADNAGNATSGQQTGGAELLTEANMEQVAANAIDVLDSATTVSSSGASLLGGVQIADAPQQVDWPMLLARQGLSLLNRTSLPGALMGGVAISKVEPCNGGGAIGFTVNDADNTNNVSKGDTLSAIFSQCGQTANGVAVVVNGKFSLQLGEVSGDVDSGNGVFDVFMAMPAPGLSVGVGSGGKLVTTTVTGEMSMNLQTNAAGSVTVARSSGMDAVSSDGRTVRYANMFLVRGHAPAASSFSIDGDISANGADFAGAYTLNMSNPATPLIFGGNRNYPDSGEMRIKANNGTLTLTAQPNAMVLLTLNSNGKTVNKSVEWCRIGNC